MDQLSPRDLELITTTADYLFDRFTKVLRIDKKYITQNQCRTIYGISVPKLKRAILEGSVRLKDRNRINPKSHLFVNRQDVERLANI